MKLAMQVLGAMSLACQIIAAPQVQSAEPLPSAVSHAAPSSEVRLPPLGCVDSSRAYHPAAPERWVAGSTTAMGITGDVTLSVDRWTLETGASAMLRYVGDWQVPPGMGSLGAKEAEAERCAALYVVEQRFTAQGLRKNVVCGGYGHPEESGYVAILFKPARETILHTYDELSLDVYTVGSDMSGLSSAPQFCASFEYFREK